MLSASERVFFLPTATFSVPDLETTLGFNMEAITGISERTFCCQLARFRCHFLKPVLASKLKPKVASANPRIAHFLKPVLASKLKPKMTSTFGTPCFFLRFCKKGEN